MVKLFKPPGSNQLGPVLRSYVFKLDSHVANWPGVSMKHQVPKIQKHPTHQCQV